MTHNSVLTLNSKIYDAKNPLPPDMINYVCSNYLVGTRISPSILKALSADVEVAGKQLWAFQNIDSRGKLP